MQFDVKIVEDKKAIEVETDDVATLKRLVSQGKFSLDSTGRVLMNLEAEGDDWVRTDAKVCTAIATWAKSQVNGKVQLPVMCSDGQFRNHDFTPQVKVMTRENGDVRYNVSNILAIRPRQKRGNAFAEALASARQQTR